MLKKYVPGITSTHRYACFTLTPVEYQEKTNEFPGLVDVNACNLWGSVLAAMVELERGGGAVIIGDSLSSFWFSCRLVQKDGQ